MVEERLRSGSSSIPVLGVRCTSNPGGASHGEVKLRYIDATNHGREVVTDADGHTVRFISAKVGDNPHVDAGYVRQLDAIPDPQRRAAMRDGSWDVFAGQFFQQFDRERHVVEPWGLPSQWARYCGIDYGYRAPFAAVWIADDEDGRIWVYREAGGTQIGESEQARLVMAADADDPQVVRMIDPSTAAKRGDAASIMDVYLREGCAVEAANNDRMAGWARIKQYMAEGPACSHHRAKGWETCPMVHIFANCENLIREVAYLPYSKVKVEDCDTKAADHYCDAFRYGVMAIGEGASFFIPQNQTRTTAIDGSPLYTDCGPFAMPPREDAEPTWFVPR